MAPQGLHTDSSATPLSLVALCKHEGSFHDPITCASFMALKAEARVQTGQILVPLEVEPGSVEWHVQAELSSASLHRSRAFLFASWGLSWVGAYTENITLFLPRKYNTFEFSLRQILRTRTESSYILWWNTTRTVSSAVTNIISSRGRLSWGSAVHVALGMAVFQDPTRMAHV